MKNNSIYFIDSWDKLTLKTYYQITDILTDTNYDNDMIDRNIKVLSILGNVDEKAFDEYTLNEIKEVFTSLTFLHEEPRAEISDYYKINGKTYKLQKDISSLKASQFVELMYFLKDQDMIRHNIPMILAILLLPTEKLSLKDRIYNTAFNTKKGRKWMEQAGYKIKILPIEPFRKTDLSETSENIFENMNASQALGIFQFFFVLSNLFSETVSQHYSDLMKSQIQSTLIQIKEQGKDMREMQPIIKQMERLKIFQGNGDGLE